MKKNLIILHLESLSNCLLSTYQDELPSLREIMAKSVKLKHFFSSATSSLMALGYVWYGTALEFDHFVSFDDLDNRPLNEHSHLFSVLQDNGYRVLGIQYPLPWRDEVNRTGIWNVPGNSFCYKETESDFYEEIKRFIEVESAQPFALYVFDLRGHLFFSDNIKAQGKTSFERIKLGYRCIDRTIKNIYDLLEQNDLQENTIIIGFGDHGDDFWTHSLSGGFCHGIEPYTNIISTPAFIYIPGESPITIENMASLVDIKKTCFGILDIEDEKHPNDQGIDIFRETHYIVFSQNLFMNQEYNRYLNKAFSATNNEYHLIVSDLGLEMYAYHVDGGNHNNLLNFFDMDGIGRLRFKAGNALHPHFKTVFSTDQIDEIVRNYSRLSQALRKWIERKQEQIADVQQYHFDFRNFKRIRRRKYLWKNVRYGSMQATRFWLKRDMRSVLSRSYNSLGRVLKRLSANVHKYTTAER